MTMVSNGLPAWLSGWMKEQGIHLWGVADLKNFSTAPDRQGKRFPYAVSFAIPMKAETMHSVRKGPNRYYADEYTRVNNLINGVSTLLADEIRKKDFQAEAVPASVRTDTENIKGDFPHKTAATRAGLGWIGRHCQLITRRYGSWVRLGSVFTDMELPCGPPVEKSFCGNCTDCVDACPAKALKGKEWHPGLAREEILDARACDQWKKEHYFQYHNGQNCGICSAVCPYGLKTLKRQTGTSVHTAWIR